MKKFTLFIMVMMVVVVMIGFVGKDSAFAYFRGYGYFTDARNISEYKDEELVERAKYGELAHLYKDGEFFFFPKGHEVYDFAVITRYHRLVREYWRAEKEGRKVDKKKIKEIRNSDEFYIAFYLIHEEEELANPSNFHMIVHSPKLKEGTKDQVYYEHHALVQYNQKQLRTAEKSLEYNPDTGKYVGYVEFVFPYSILPETQLNDGDDSVPLTASLRGREYHERIETWDFYIEWF